MTRPSPSEHPLLLEIQATQDEGGHRRPLAHVPLLLHAFDLDDNSRALRPTFELNGRRHALPTCAPNGRQVGPLHAWTNDDGRVLLQLYLDLEALAQVEEKPGNLHLPSARSPLLLRISAESGPQAGRTTVMQGSCTLVLDHVARISAMVAQAPSYKRYRGHQNWDWHEPAAAPADASMEARVERIPTPAHDARAAESLGWAHDGSHQACPTEGEPGSPRARGARGTSTVGQALEEGTHLRIHAAGLGSPPTTDEGWTLVTPGWIGLELEFLDGHRTCVRIEEQGAPSWVAVGRENRGVGGAWRYLRTGSGAHEVSTLVTETRRRGDLGTVLLCLSGGLALVAGLLVLGWRRNKRTLVAAQRAGLVALAAYRDRRAPGRRTTEARDLPESQASATAPGATGDCRVRAGEGSAAGAAVVLPFRRRHLGQSLRDGKPETTASTSCSYCFTHLENDAESCSFCGVSRGSTQQRGLRHNQR